jgi:hypothetical protein
MTADGPTVNAGDIPGSGCRRATILLSTGRSHRRPSARTWTLVSNATYPVCTMRMFQTPGEQQIVHTDDESPAASAMIATEPPDALEGFRAAKRHAGARHRILDGDGHGGISERVATEAGQGEDTCRNESDGKGPLRVTAVRSTTSRQSNRSWRNDRRLRCVPCPGCP